MYDVIRNWHIIATSIHCYALVLLKDLTSTCIRYCHTFTLLLLILDKVSQTTL